jgi:hypothetical protein
MSQPPAQDKAGSSITSNSSQVFAGRNCTVFVPELQVFEIPAFFLIDPHIYLYSTTFYV